MEKERLPRQPIPGISQAETDAIEIEALKGASADAHETGKLKKARKHSMKAARIAEGMRKAGQAEVLDEYRKTVNKEQEE